MCVECPTGWECCGYRWGNCICQRPVWNSCCKRIDDPHCASENAAIAARTVEIIYAKANGLGHFFERAKNITKDLVQKSKDLLEGVVEKGKKLAENIIDKTLKALRSAGDRLYKAIDVFRTTESAVAFAKKSLGIAKRELENVKKLYKVGVKALKALKSFIATKIINIHEIYFKVALSVANSGKFQCRMKGVVVGRNLDVNLNFDIKDILSIAKSLGEKVISGISDFIG